MVFMEISWSVFLWVNGPAGGRLTLGSDPGCSMGQCEYLAPKQCHAVPAVTNSPLALPVTVPWHTGTASVQH